MASVIKVDGYDLYPYLRVAPGEGFDPIDPQVVEPRFTDSTLREGQALINTSAGNREMIVPVHVSPRFSQGSYTSSRDGLSQQIVELNRTLRDAKRLEWRDENSTNSTYFDVEFARFEPDYNYRRAQGLLVSGNIHIWAKPFGDTGAERLVASALATGPVLAIPIASVAGDIEPNYTGAITIGAATTPVPTYNYNYNPDGRFVGVAVVPSGYISLWTAASIGASAGALAGDQTSVASQYRSVNTGFVPSVFSMVANFITTGSMYHGRQRVYALARSNSPYAHVLEGRYNFNQKFGEARIASHHGALFTRGWSTVDLGVVDIDTNSTSLFSIGVGAYAAGRALNHGVHVSAIILVPEDNFEFVNDTERRVLAHLSIGSGQTNTGTYPVRYDTYGNRILPSFNASALPMHATTTVTYGAATGYLLHRPLVGSFTTAGLMIDHTLVSDIEVTAYGAELVQSTANSSAAIEIGKRTETNNQVAVRWAHISPSQHSLSLLVNGILQASEAFVPSSSFTTAVLEFATVGSTAYGSIRAAAGFTATVTAQASAFDDAGQAYIMLRGSGVINTPIAYISDHLTVKSNPSRPHSARERFVWTASSSHKNAMNLASGARTELNNKVRGPGIKITPGKYEQLLAFSLPVRPGPLNDFITADLNVTERFSFSR